MNQEQMAAAFNEWMRRFTEEPERFEREFQTVERFLDEELAEGGPSYGRTCVAYLASIIKEQAV